MQDYQNVEHTFGPIYNRNSKILTLVWDVIANCSIVGSSDTSIKDVIVNDFTDLLQYSKIEKIFVNGTKAYELYCKYAESKTGIKAIKLPSTSPANAAWSFEKLCRAWGEELKKLLTIVSYSDTVMKNHKKEKPNES